jgi:hypothetical protein
MRVYNPKQQTLSAGSFTIFADDGDRWRLEEGDRWEPVRTIDFENRLEEARCRLHVYKEVERNVLHGHYGAATEMWMVERVLGEPGIVRIFHIDCPRQWAGDDEWCEFTTTEIHSREHVPMAVLRTI